MPDLLYGPEGIAYQSIDVKEWLLTDEELEDTLDDLIEEELHISEVGM